ncbi:winged helix-turn-helix transcriptional regulator [Thermococcus sp.]|uniref:helix-turn-helix transcriptional regulator n=1 Tax=Thermococcus sp. TaxID=35749 RepID=UPI0026191F1B|nr:winged helix-turn-helix transcriptional regulator [Thermococcus sp.]
MEYGSRLKLIAPFALMVLMLTLLPVMAQYEISSIVLQVYEDGYVQVNMIVVPDNYTSQVEVPLLGEHVENIIVTDGDGNPLDYNEENGRLLIYSGMSHLVNVSYYTPDLTSKAGIVWTLNVSSEVPFTIVLPQNAVVVDLSDIPDEIAGNAITMPPGNQSISYTLTGIESTSENPGESGGSSNIHALMTVLLLAGGLVGLAYAFRRKSRGFSGRIPTREEFEERLGNLNLNDDERRALLYLLDRGGKASQAEVREAIGLPKTTAWRMFKRLEREGLVKILRGKKENWVELRF